METRESDKTLQTQNDGAFKKANMATMKSDGTFKKEKKRLLDAGEGQLYVDHDFPANKASIGAIAPSPERLPNAKWEWKRPWDIVRRGLQPVFIQDGATRFDFHQGALGDCWFLGAAACLAVTGVNNNKGLLYNVIKPEGCEQSFQNEYAGIFRFCFWRYGKWVEVIIDDFLPTINGDLVFAHNRHEPNEFWAALMEKAYAKIHGSYASLEDGLFAEAFVDFTGGITKSYNLEAPIPRPSNLYEIMRKAIESHCMMGACNFRRHAREPRLSEGLLLDHAYSVTGVSEIQTLDGESHELVRVRNPWGHLEWTGDWADRSPLWKRVPQKTKEKLGFKKGDDGEFWMSFTDWFRKFERLEICYLSAGVFLNPVDLPSDKAKWLETPHFGRWEPGVSAGGRGSRPYEANYWKNPQYKVQLPGKPDGGKCTMLVSLMEFNSRKNWDIYIGVSVYKDGGDQGGRRHTHKVADSGIYAYQKETTAHFTGEPGNYVVIPSTYHPDQDASFLLRIFTE